MDEAPEWHDTHPLATPVLQSRGITSAGEMFVIQASQNSEHGMQQQSDRFDETRKPTSPYHQLHCHPEHENPYTQPKVSKVPQIKAQGNTSPQHRRSATAALASFKKSKLINRAWRHPRC